jgi:hypothetical protein
LEFPENAIYEQGIPEEFPSIPDLGNADGNDLGNADGNSSGIPFSKMALSGNSSEFPYRGGILVLQGVLFTGGYCFIYREVPWRCLFIAPLKRSPYLRLQNQKRTGAKSSHSGPV